MKEFISNNKKLLILAGIVVLLLVILLIVTLVNGSKKETLILECTSQTKMSDSSYNISQTINLYETKNSLEFVMGVSFISEDKENVFNTENLSKVLKNQMEFNIANLMNDILEYTVIEEESLKNGASIKITYTINNKNNQKFNEYFGINFIDTSIEEKIIFFEEVGFSCKKY